MANKQVSAVDIKELYYCDPTLITADLTPIALKQLLANSAIVKIENVHQDTWQIEESEASQDSYRNQLTGNVYRFGRKTMGELTFNFTIGRYDYATKAALLGGTVLKKGGSGADKEDAIGWKRARGVVEIKKCFVALTLDDQYAVLPYANTSAREANTDGAIGLAVTATMMEPEIAAVSPEYWYDKDVVDKAQ